VTLSRRAVAALSDLRISRSSHVTGQGTVVHRVDDVSWWTWAGARANATLAIALSSISDPERGYDNHRVRLRPEVTREEMAEATGALGGLCDVRADVDEDAVRGLKFSDVLPPRLARDTVALRLTDWAHAERVMTEPRHW
jgi:ATP-dependent Lhr-like helicase